VLIAVVALSATCATAQEPAAPAAEEGAADWGPNLVTVGACFAAALAALAGGLAIAKIAARCLEGMARQPEAAGSMFGPMFIAAAMVEGLMLYTITVCLLVVLR
jgi:F-type H+-transporting ATPase subunit c